jgi:protein-arginine kinase activator protein McsA
MNLKSITHCPRCNITLTIYKNSGGRGCQNCPLIPYEDNVSWIYINEDNSYFEIGHTAYPDYWFSSNTNDLVVINDVISYNVNESMIYMSDDEIANIIKTILVFK